MKKDVFNGKRLKIARVYRGKSVDILAKETNINKKDIFKIMNISFFIFQFNYL